MMAKGVRRLIQKLINSFGYQLVTRAGLDSDMDQDARFRRIYGNCKEFTLTTKERMYALYQQLSMS